MSGSIHPITAQCLKMQGFTGCNDETLRAIRPWLRLGPGLCGAGVVAGTLLESPPILWALVTVAALGVILPVHPFDVPYNYVIRRWAGTPAIPSYGRPRRFACAMASVWLSMTALVLEVGQSSIALTLAAVFMLSPIINVTTDFCVASWLYHRLIRITSAIRSKTRKSIRDQVSGFAGLR